MKPILNRRHFISATALAAGGLWISGCDGTRHPPEGGYTNDPFSLGVASGDPTPSGVVLWTRLAPTPLDPVAPNAPSVWVGWEVAEDQRFRRIVQTGVQTARAESAFSVHVEVDGLLPGREYFYRFFVEEAVSPTGRTKTAPLIGAPLETLRFAVASCQSYTQGFYGAFRDMASAVPDLVLHVGDYIYEGPWTMPVRRAPSPQAITLDDYRAFHAAAKTDPHLQAAHAIAPWLMVWDDHEVVNDYRGDHPIFGSTAEAHVARRRAAYQAYFEHMPLRRRARPIDGAMQLYQRSVFGDLAQFDMLDTRQYRSDHPCHGPKGETPYWISCDVSDPNRTILGMPQEKWLARGYGIGGAKWNFLVQSTQLTPFTSEKEGIVLSSSDRWDAYPAARTRLFELIKEKGVPNPTLIGGDIHAFLANSLIDPPDGQPVANELVTAAISSGGGGDERYDAETSQYASRNRPFYFENRRNGYLLCQLTPAALTAEARVVSTVLDPNADSKVLKSLVFEDGALGPQDI